MRAVIRLEGLAKGYRLYRRPADRLLELLSRRPRHQRHWALSDIDLTIEAGETFGLIGENGAGKSTLLKLIAGTSRPSRGRISVDGRVAALLELGAGFHPEESGRDNVYLMGALNGIKPRQMARYYDEIASFSELSEEVLGWPVKTYSSGMFMRLAFATATAVDPDILIVDEALSVGDMYFQKKSLDRIMGFRERGKTVLFCSHNLYQIRSLCSRAAWLHSGHIQALGDVETVATAYESHERDKQAAFGRSQTNPLSYRPAVSGSSPVRIREVTIEGLPGADRPYLETFQDMAVRVEVESLDVQVPFHVGVVIVRNDRENVFGTSTHFESDARPLQAASRRQLALELPRLALLSGEYWLSIYVLDDSGLQVYDLAEQICPFTVHNPGRSFGIVELPYRWRLEA